MEIYCDDRKKQIQIWLTRQESQDESLRSRLKPIYTQWKQQKYLVAVFHSGTQDLQSSTVDLLLHNKKAMAEQAARMQEKQRPKQSQIAIEQ